MRGRPMKPRSSSASAVFSAPPMLPFAFPTSLAHEPEDTCLLRKPPRSWLLQTAAFAVAQTSCLQVRRREEATGGGANSRRKVRSGCAGGARAQADSLAAHQTSRLQRCSEWWASIFIHCSKDEPLCTFAVHLSEAAAEWQPMCLWWSRIDQLANRFVQRQTITRFSQRLLRRLHAQHVPVHTASGLEIQAFSGAASRAIRPGSGTFAQVCFLVVML